MCNKRQCCLKVSQVNGSDDLHSLGTLLDQAPSTHEVAGMIVNNVASLAAYFQNFPPGRATLLAATKLHVLGETCGQRCYVVSRSRLGRASVCSKRQCCLTVSQVNGSDDLHNLGTLLDQAPSTHELTRIIVNNVARPGGNFENMRPEMLRC